MQITIGSNRDSSFRMKITVKIGIKNIQQYELCYEC